MLSFTLRQFVTKATAEELQPLSRNDLSDWSKLRNTARTVSKSEAGVIVEGVESMIATA